MNRLLRNGWRICGILLVAALACGCSLGSEETFFSKPGAYDYFSCADLAKATEDARQREEKVKILIDRAEQGSFGALVATTTYQTRYLQAKADLNRLAETSRQKNCPAAAPVSPSKDGPVQ